MASITTAGTCQHRSQSASASTSRFVVPNSRVSCARRAGGLGDGTRIVAAIPALPMSMPHTRSPVQRLVGHLIHIRALLNGYLPEGAARGAGLRKNLTRALEAQ